MQTLDQKHARDLGEGADISAGARPNRTLVIASTPRSGSSMLGALCARTGRLGVPREYMEPGALAWLSRRFGTDDAAVVLREVMARRSSADGVFAIKLHYDHRRTLPGFFDLRAALPDPRLVLIERDDAMAQALSLARSWQTGAYNATLQARGEARFDPRLIERALRLVTLHAAAWRYETARQGLPWIRLSFDEVVADPPGAVARIAEVMDVRIAAEDLPTAPPTRPMPRDPEAASWPDRWRAQARAEPPFEAAETPRARERPAVGLRARAKRKLRQWIDRL
ncbi:MAG: Stf0 family sulfotransferase [Pseudomonadota bacterium]